MFAFLSYAHAQGTKNSPRPDYAKIFAEDYTKALDFMRSNQRLIKEVCAQYEVPALDIMSVVFPEIIRYNAFVDFFESGALEVAYIKGGTQAADFSIGHFQIKPSFAESIERCVSRDADSDWARTMRHAFAYSTSEQLNTELQRRRRHERLQNTRWQIVYACAFYRYVQHKHAAHLSRKMPVERIRFLATAYNGGFLRSAESIEKSQNYRFFPDGVGYPQKDQYNYADVSRYAYEKALKDIFSEK